MAPELNSIRWPRFAHARKHLTTYKATGTKGFRTTVCKIMALSRSSKAILLSPNEDSARTINELLCGFATASNTVRNATREAECVIAAGSGPRKPGQLFLEAKRVSANWLDSNNPRCELRTLFVCLLNSSNSHHRLHLTCFVYSSFKTANHLIRMRSCWFNLTFVRFLHMCSFCIPILALLTSAASRCPSKRWWSDCRPGRDTWAIAARSPVRESARNGCRSDWAPSDHGRQRRAMIWAAIYPSTGCSLTHTLTFDDIHPPLLYRNVHILSCNLQS